MNFVNMMILCYKKNMIKSEIIKIHQAELLDDKYIEEELRKQSIDPVRWAIVDADDKDFFVSVSYVSKVKEN